MEIEFCAELRTIYAFLMQSKSELLKFQFLLIEQQKHQLKKHTKSNYKFDSLR